MAYFGPDKPFNELPLLPPPASVLEHPRVLGACIPAARALAELRGDVHPCAELIGWLLPALEARWSAALEKIEASVDELMVWAALERGPGSVQQVWRIARAIRLMADNPESWCISRHRATDLACQVMGGRVDVRGVGVDLQGPTRTVYTPPVGDNVLSRLLDDWEQFVRPLCGLSRIDPLIKLAVQHYQFEAIHPFVDGNGRAGRLLNILYAFEQEMMSRPVMNLSRWFWIRRNDYYRLLLAVSEKGRWVDWVEYVLNGIEDCCLWARTFFSRLRHEALDVQRMAALPGVCAPKHRDALASFLGNRVYFTREQMCRSVKTHPYSVTKITQALARHGLIERRRVGPAWLFCVKPMRQAVVEFS